MPLDRSSIQDAFQFLVLRGSKDPESKTLESLLRFHNFNILKNIALGKDVVGKETFISIFETALDKSFSAVPGPYQEMIWRCAKIPLRLVSTKTSSDPTTNYNVMILFLQHEFIIPVMNFQQEEVYSSHWFHLSVSFYEYSVWNLNSIWLYLGASVYIYSTASTSVYWGTLFITVFTFISFSF